MTELFGLEIFENATALIQGARSSIRMTMNAEEELQDPLPTTYFALLEKKLNEGITIERIGFGTQETFRHMEKIHSISPHYSFYRTDAADYQRMLLIDDAVLMFAKQEVDGRHVYRTEDSACITEYRAYFTAHLP